MESFSKIDIANAKITLTEIGNELSEPVLLIGGIAVNHYIKSRDSYDIDLVCDYKISQKIIKGFKTEVWKIEDDNDDPERPSFKISHKTHDGLIIKFGPKILEREAYKYLTWEHFFGDSVNITYKNKRIKNIVIPNPSYLAYMKLISFYFREDETKRIQDLTDFINLSNDHKFSIALFQKIITLNKAESLMLGKPNVFHPYYKRLGINSVIFNFMEYFSYDTKSDDSEELDSNTFERGDANFITKMVDAALFFRDATVFAEDEIKRCISNQKVIPNRLLYKTEPGCKKWLELCNSPEYSFFSRSYNNLNNKSADICSSIINKSGRTDFDFISLGVGDGRKDALLLSGFLERLDDDELLYYYPMDINITMIETAAQNLLSLDVFEENKLRIKPFVGDFFGIGNMDLFYNYRKSPNIFSILGNTIGNSEESELIQTLQEAIKENDFLVVEFNTNQDLKAVSALEKNKVSRALDLSPLAILSTLGISIQDKDLTYTTISSISNKYSVVPKTISSIAEYKLDGRKMKKIKVPFKGKVKLSVVHYYDFESFILKIQKELNMDVIFKSNNDGVGIVVLNMPAKQ